MSHSLPPLDAFQALLTAAQQGSFSRAAEKLGLTHGAISRRIAAVEGWAGVRLFERHGRGVRPTLSGKQIIDHIEFVLVQLDDVQHVRRLLPQLPAVRVSVVESFARLWLLPHLAVLEGSPPDVRIVPEVENRYMTMSADRIAIRLGAGTWPGTLARPLFHERLRPYASEAVARRIGVDARPETILAEPLIHDLSVENWRLWFNCPRLDLRPEDRILSSYDLALLAAAQGLGVVLLREPYGLEQISQLGLMPVSSHAVANPLAFHVVMSAGRRSPAVDIVAERLLRAGDTTQNLTRQLAGYEQGDVRP